MDNEREIARFFDCCRPAGQEKLNTRLGRRARQGLIDGLEDFSGKTVLEIGSGGGELTRELVRRGAARAVGIDLAEQTVAGATKRAADEGLSDRIEYRVGNGAKDPLGQHDIVVLDKVICCYPDWERLVDNTSSAAQQTYGFIIPRSDGFGSLAVRAFIAIERMILRIKRCGFTPYVHDYWKIDSYLMARGFRRTRLYRGPLWMTAVYARA